MVTGEFNLAAEPIRQFMDAVDLVLNSNTFILEFPVTDRDIHSSLRSFLSSPGFQSELLRQDRERGWSNLCLYNSDNDSYEVRPGLVVRDNFVLKLSGPHVSKSQYLAAMIKGDTSIGPFFSFYLKQRPKEEAEAIVNALTSYLFKDQSWELLIVETSFLWNATDRFSTGEIYYFEEEGGNNSATVIADEKFGYLILTNGID
jgi:hypothetical protein